MNIKAYALLELCVNGVQILKESGSMEPCVWDKVKFFEIRLSPLPNTSIFVKWHVCNKDVDTMNACVCVCGACPREECS